MLTEMRRLKQGTLLQIHLGSCTVTGDRRIKL
jgi:hypothetical protein